MNFKLYCNSEYLPDLDAEGTRWPILQSCNDGFYRVIYLLWLLEQRGIHSEIIYTSHMPPEELEAVYASVIPLSVSKKYRIRRVFGTKNQSGIRFGIQVPAILVFEEGGLSPVDIYPRQEEQYRYVGICNYLVGLLRTSGLPNYERLVMLRNYNRQRRSL